MENILEIIKAILAAIGLGVVWNMAIIVISFLASLIKIKAEARHG